MDISPEQLEICLKVLQQVSDNPAILEEQNQLKQVLVKVQRRMRRYEQKKQRKCDRTLQATTAIVQQQKALVTDFNLSLPSFEEDTPHYHYRKTCYICKQAYTQIHHFYHLLCPDCAELNYQKRQQRTDLTGRIALVTGGRVKIGYQTSLRLLRDGAKVIVTTRFPQDCARRYSLETDFHQWCERLQIYSIDFRNLPALESLIQRLLQTEPYLDILINNAAQTIKQPLSSYQAILAQEQATVKTLPPVAQALIVSGETVPLLEGTSQSLETVKSLVSAVDQDGQPIDYSLVNSWVLKLDQVSAIELLEVQFVNAIAPFILNSKLKALMIKSPFTKRFIVNVSAMEGQFNRKHKTVYHPHTNMAKAALNMMTRTSAADYAQVGIFMNSVDTGWITDENPYFKKVYRQTEQGFYSPLDSIDGMARIYDPIVQGLEGSESPMYGYFLKDYLPYPW